MTVDEIETDGEDSGPKPSFLRIVMLVLAFQLGGWLVFDGMRALTVGDYVTPAEGDFAGQLGPWSDLVQAIGLDPRGLPVKLWHVLSGLVWLGVVLRDTVVRRARAPFLIALPFGLWYLPFGTGIAIAVAIMAMRDPELREQS